MPDICPYFGLCGGCEFQDIPYAQQVKRKERKLRKLFTKAKLPFPEKYSFIPAEDPFNYRTRLDLAFGKDGPGLRQKNNYHTVVPIQQCQIANLKLNKLLAELWEWYKINSSQLEAFSRLTRLGTLRYAVIRTPEFTDSASITFVLNKDSLLLEQHLDLLKAFAARSSAPNVLYGLTIPESDLSVLEDYTLIKGGDLLEDLFGNTKIQYHSQGFFQNNSRVGETMLEYCRSLFQEKDYSLSTLVDYYGGAGTFGLGLGKGFAKTLIIDNSQINIDCALKNIQLNNLNNAWAVCLDALDANLPSGEKVYVIVDPPRAGLHRKVIQKLLAAAPQKIIYVSCNPAQLIQELNKFTGYKLESFAAFDHFPQTAHLEAIAELSRPC